MNSGLERVLPSPEVLQALLKWAGADQQVYLVGGVVRDALLGIANHDLDFAVSGDVRRFARGVAGTLGGSFYMMDLKHQTARIVLNTNGQPYYLDFSTIRGDSIETDLRSRDFTVNAMAIDITHSERIIDPLGGAQHLKDRILSACSPTAFTDDPVRLLLAVRQSVAYDLRIKPETLQWLKQAVALLPSTSVERQRDEFFRILEGRRVATALRILDQLGLLEQIVPEIVELKGTLQSEPHKLNVWDHTIAAVDCLEDLFDLLVATYSGDKRGNLLLGMASAQLGRYRDQFIKHFDAKLTPGRNLRGLLVLAALLHDIAKPQNLTIDGDGRTHFYQHESPGSEIAEVRLRTLAFSNVEIERVRRLVFNHMRIHQLVLSGKELSRRSIYRFFRNLGDAGVDACLLSLADTLATYGVTITPASWEQELLICRRILDAWFNQNPQIINPQLLINGSDLIRHFELEPGPLIGKMLAAIREAQAAGQVITVEDALEYAKLMLSQSTRPEERPHDGA